MQWRMVNIMSMIGLLLLTGGCSSLQLKGGQDPAEAYQGAATWPFVPVKMQLTPFTEIAYDEQVQAWFLEPHVKAFDRVGDVTKAVGDFRFELYRVENPRSSGNRGLQRLYSWEASVRQLDQNTRHYDSTLREYVFRLRLDSRPEEGVTVLLRAYFVDPEGQRITTQLERQIGELIAQSESES